MGDRTGIAWCDATWNPTRGCSRVSEGCRNCYAERQAVRHSGPGGSYEGLARSTPEGPRWTGEVRLVPKMLDQPLRWRKSRRIFVNSMSDLFHEKLTNEEIAAVFGVMAACPRHTFIVLTKRAKRMREWFQWVVDHDRACPPMTNVNSYLLSMEHQILGDDGPHHCKEGWLGDPEGTWPLPHVVLGVSAEDQTTYHERIGELLRTPAACRMVSYEPALGPLDFRWGGQSLPEYLPYQPLPKLDWLIVGGESGPGARACDVEWIRSAVRQCQKAQVPCFVKQLGSQWYSVGAKEPETRGHKSGADPWEWPPDLRIQEFPEL